MFLDTTWQQQIVNAINKANFSGKDKDWEVVGTYVGSIAANILEFQVPWIQYVYGKSIKTELNA
jgi:hypothetical protein